MFKQIEEKESSICTIQTKDKKQIFSGSNCNPLMNAYLMVKILEQYISSIEYPFWESGENFGIKNKCQTKFVFRYEQLQNRKEGIGTYVKLFLHSVSFGIFPYWDEHSRKLSMERTGDNTEPRLLTYEIIMGWTRIVSLFFLPTFSLLDRRTDLAPPDLEEREEKFLKDLDLRF